MKRLQQGVVMIFSIVAVLTYISSLHLPTVKVSNIHQGNMMLFAVNEQYEVMMQPASIVCVDSKDCILKSYSLLLKPNGILPKNTVIEDLVLEEGVLILRMNTSFLSLKQKKEQEAFLWYLLQFEDVKKIKVFVDEVEWKIPVPYDDEKVYSTNFHLYTADLYLSMPFILFRNVEGVEQIETIRIPYTEDIESLVEWMLYAYQETNITVTESVLHDGILNLNVTGKVKNENVFQSMTYSLLVLENVKEIVLRHEGIVVKDVKQEKMYGS